ncbi:M23 family metallopeptidase [Halarcobacter ebronensis]|uniref:Peptidase M24 n=1 Tax=Halarcobacter ebronensis TaxID=1462615 RepID=A0A4Q1ALI5_9BACT|nr:M23 family metallopeptidase [Halarcobacter ebronensis]QKF80933.1 zinc metallopeptidase, M23 family [Halarcobacter ebronensis]RXK06251.1 peptidase M24 [Halarcobacter ebronensis]
MRRQNSNISKFLFFIFIIIVIIIGGFVYFSPLFEKTAPKITINNNGYWNVKDDIKVSLFDDSGIKSFKVFYEAGDKTEVILDNNNLPKGKSIGFNIKALTLTPDIKEIKLVIEAYDNSMWNLFKGNRAYEEYNLKIDKKRPIARVITNSYNIRRGGSAAVVVEVSDENLEDKYITFNNDTRFELIPYMKEGFYTAIIAWPIDIEFDSFERVNLVAVDKANNKTITKIPLYIKDLAIKRDKLTISDNFVNRVSIPVLQKSGYDVPTTNVEIFVKQNEELRANNVKTIKKVSLDNMSKELETSFDIKPFKRLQNSKRFAGFAERRSYYYDGEKIDEAWHLGMDWASIKHAPIEISNKGKVIFSDYLGIYGNTLIVDHGFGIQSLYAHTSRFNVNKDQELKIGQEIANTGSTGAVFGDHLHFGVLIQGIEVNPLEWMDANWIKTRVTNILEEANQEIRSSK